MTLGNPEGVRYSNRVGKILFRDEEIEVRGLTHAEDRKLASKYMIDKGLSYYKFYNDRLMDRNLTPEQRAALESSLMHVTTTLELASHACAEEKLYLCVTNKDLAWLDNLTTEEIELLKGKINSWQMMVDINESYMEIFQELKFYLEEVKPNQEMNTNDIVSIMNKIELDQLTLKKKSNVSNTALPNVNINLAINADDILKNLQQTSSEK